MGKALYRKYRSRKLAEIVGQEHVTTLLQNALKSGRIAHAYLFTGPRGVGKTSIARILAHEINDLPYADDTSHLDIIEIDAASNNGVDDIRDLRERVNLAPTSAKKKIYIIDEVHMLSKAAFNALLKTLEEPPEHVVFILATTDADKLPDTIVSRTQRHTFHRASIASIIQNLEKITATEKIAIDTAALQLIAEHADGSFRDSVSLLDQLANISGKETITATMIEQSLGLAPKERITQLVDSVAHRDFQQVITLLRDIESQGTQPSIIAEQLVRHIVEHAQDTPQLLGLTDDLLKVRQSSMPQATLITALGQYAAPKKSAPAHVEAVTALEVKATEIAPKDDIVKKAPAQPKAKPNPAPTAKEDSHKDELVAKASTQEETPEPKQRPKKASKKPTGTTIDWAALVTGSKNESIGLSSLLAKCSGESEDGVMTIYTRNEFWRKKLSTPAYQQILHTLLEDQSGHEWEIELIPGMPPSNNSHVNTVAAIMGGGEEVAL